MQSFIDGRPIVPVYWDKYFNNSDIKWKHNSNNLWIIDPSDPSENIADKITAEESDYINSEAVLGVNKLHSGKYEFLYIK